MTRSFALVCVFALLSAGVAHAQEVGVSDAFDEQYFAEQVSIDLNDVRVCDTCTIYIAGDDAVYVSAADIDAWQLKRSKKAAFERDGERYFGLQSDLNLATSYDRERHELEVVAPNSAFRGQPKARQQVTAGHGAFLNYQLSRENNEYTFVSGGPGGVFQTKYLSTAGAGGLEFHRGTTRWLHLDTKRNRAVSIGDDTSDGGWLGISAPFAGVRYLSDYSADPQYVSHAPPTVSGVADAPSLLDVYADNILVLQRYVPEGPFTVYDLPTSAAHSDIVLVLTGPSGAKTYEAARPQYDPNFLGRGFSSFRVDAGVGHQNVNLRGQFYRGLVAQGMVRYGLTDRITSEIFGESINGENFADAGADLLLGSSNTLGFRIGGGNRRHAGEYRLDVRSGSIRFRTKIAYNSQKQEPLSEVDFGNVVAQIADTSGLDVTITPDLQAGFELSRVRTNTGSFQSTLSTRIGYRRGSLDLSLAPQYDLVTHLTSANIAISIRLLPNETITLDSAISTSGATSSGVEFSKEPLDPADPFTARIKGTYSESQSRSANFTDSMTWGVANVNWEQQSGKSIFEPRLSGALAFVGGGVDPIRYVNEGEAFGVLTTPARSGLGVDVNASPAGTTNARGRLLLRGLSAYRENTVKLQTGNLPIWANVIDPVRVVPEKWSPVDVRIDVASRGGMTFRAVDAQGLPLPVGSEMLGPGGTHFPVGYDGLIYITGLGAGLQQLHGTSAQGVCTIDLAVPANIDDIPDLGTQRCVAQLTVKNQP
jgi:outer membrane usher protein